MKVREIWDILLDILYSAFGFNINGPIIDSEEERGLSYLTPRAWRIYSILNTVDVHKPKSNRSFMKNVRRMHKYQFALSFINNYGHVTKAYAEEMVAKKLITPQIEEIYIRQKYNHRNLIYYINDAGHKWSPQAKKLIKKLHPIAYKSFFKK